MIQCTTSEARHFVRQIHIAAKGYPALHFPRAHHLAAEWEKEYEDVAEVGIPRWGRKDWT